MIVPSKYPTVSPIRRQIQGLPVLTFPIVLESSQIMSAALTRPTQRHRSLEILSIPAMPDNNDP